MKTWATTKDLMKSGYTETLEVDQEWLKARVSERLGWCPEVLEESEARQIVDLLIQEGVEIKTKETT